MKGRAHKIAFRYSKRRPSRTSGNEGGRHPAPLTRAVWKTLNTGRSIRVPALPRTVKVNLYRRAKVQGLTLHIIRSGPAYYLWLDGTPKTRKRR